MASTPQTLREAANASGILIGTDDTPHPINDRIPLVLAGPRIRRRHVLRQPVSLLDVPPTLLWTLGVEIPAEYEGSVLREAFIAAEAVDAVACCAGSRIWVTP